MDALVYLQDTVQQCKGAGLKPASLSFKSSSTSYKRPIRHTINLLDFGLDSRESSAVVLALQRGLNFLLLDQEFSFTENTSHRDIYFLAFNSQQICFSGNVAVDVPDLMSLDFLPDHSRDKKCAVFCFALLNS